MNERRARRARRVLAGQVVSKSAVPWTARQALELAVLTTFITLQVDDPEGQTALYEPVEVGLMVQPVPVQVIPPLLEVMIWTLELLGTSMAPALEGRAGAVGRGANVGFPVAVAVPEADEEEAAVEEMVAVLAPVDTVVVVVVPVELVVAAAELVVVVVVVRL